ncbi:MAG: UDP-N-acetylmuramoyl-L-alanyl-D-glutamate--2,6-diaminopimelate ligase [Pseudomonadota bacterium]|nr:UDP-N-acetylmuramoyl-L-alanyl-D-glutamate--2,6-diaminopimelate ligase [Pseudomonadota bacterium]
MEVSGNYQSTVADLAASVGEISEDYTVVLGIQTAIKNIVTGDLWVCKSPSIAQCHTAKQAGAVAILCEEAVETSLSVIVVKDIEFALGLMLNTLYEEPTSHMQVMAVTGTNGKTTVSYLCAAAMQFLQKSAFLVGTLGHGIPGQLRKHRYTTPPAGELHQSLASARDRGAEYVAMEASSHGLDQGRLSGVMIDVAVFTNLTHEHLDYHQTINAYLAAKQKLMNMRSVGVSIINVDDPSGEIIAQKCPKVVWACSLHSIPRGFKRWSYGQVRESSLQGVAVKVTTHEASYFIESNLIGAFNAENLVMAHAVLCLWGIDGQEAARALGAIISIPGRMQRLQLSSLPCEVIVDYSHTPAALERVLGELDRLKSNRLWVVFGCGGDRDVSKRPSMGAIAERLADEVILTDDNPRTEDSMKIIADIKSGMKCPSFAQVVPNRGDAIRFALREANENDIVLIAGKGHETVMETAVGKIYFSDIAKVEEIISE